MALDSLFDLLNSGVTEVTKVQASNGGLSGCNPAKPDGVTEVTPPPTAPIVVTLVTPQNPMGLQPEPLQTGACTLVTPVTPKTINAETPEPFDPEAWEERAGIAEYDGGLSRPDAEALAWLEDDRRRCSVCANLTASGVCSVAAPGALVSARRGYRPAPDWLQRCAGYVPGEADPDRRTVAQRWPGLI